MAAVERELNHGECAVSSATATMVGPLKHPATLILRDLRLCSAGYHDRYEDRSGSMTCVHTPLYMCILRITL